MKTKSNWRHMLGLALSAVMLSSIVMAGCGGGGDDDSAAPANAAANKPAKDSVDEP
jgi:hypothetical protein